MRVRFNVQCLDLSPDLLEARSVDHIDIAFDELSSDKHYIEQEDPKKFKSTKTSTRGNILCFWLVPLFTNMIHPTDRGPLIEGWRDDHRPLMCSYKAVSASFEVWGFQTRVEDYIHRCIRDVLLLGHRQAFAWIDEWLDMSIADVREFELKAQAETNAKVLLTEEPATSEEAVSADEAGDAVGQLDSLSEQPPQPSCAAGDVAVI